MDGQSFDMQGHAPRCAERSGELGHKNSRSLSTKSPHFVLTIIEASQKFWKPFWELSESCSQIVWTALHVARMGPADLLWTVSYLARSTKEWGRACDKRPRLISNICHGTDYKQYCHVGSKGIAGNLPDSKSASCRQEHLTRDFSHAPCTCDHTHTVAQGSRCLRCAMPSMMSHV